MVNITINMTMEDFEYIKAELTKAKENTELSPVADVKDYLKESVNSAHTQIIHVMNKLGIE